MWKEDCAPQTIDPSSHTRRSQLQLFSQVFHPCHDVIIDNTWRFSVGFTQISRRFCRGLVRSHVVCAQRGRYHDYAQISFFLGRGVFHGMCRGHESNVFHVVFSVSCCLCEWERIIVWWLLMLLARVSTDTRFCISSLLFQITPKLCWIPQGRRISTRRSK